MEKKRSTRINYIFFIILMMFQSCSINDNQQTQTVDENPIPEIKIDSTIIEKRQDWRRYYRKLYIKESGMDYVIYTSTNSSDFYIVNITKDSLDCLIAKQRLEIINNYK